MIHAHTGSRVLSSIGVCHMQKTQCASQDCNRTRPPPSAQHAPRDCQPPVEHGAHGSRRAARLHSKDAFLTRASLAFLSPAWRYLASSREQPARTAGKRAAAGQRPNLRAAGRPAVQFFFPGSGGGNRRLTIAPKCTASLTAVHTYPRGAHASGARRLRLHYQDPRSAHGSADGEGSSNAGGGTTAGPDCSPSGCASEGCGRDPAGSRCG